MNEGGSFDKSGKLQFPVGMNTAQKVQAYLFGKYSNDASDVYFDKLNGKQSAEQKEVKQVYDQVQQLKEAGNTEAAQGIVDGLTDAQYEIYKSVKSADTAQKTVQGKKEILPTYQKVQKLVAEGKKDEAQAVVDSLSDDEYKYYTLVKKQVGTDEKASQGVKPDFPKGEPQTPTSLINTVTTYAKAIGVDPITAFNRIFTGQKIRYVANGTVVVERLPLAESQAIKDKQNGKNAGFKLDHVIPLELGGSNAESNLALVPTDQWASYTPVENALGKALRGGKIDRKTAQKLITQFKTGLLTAQQVYDAI